MKLFTLLTLLLSCCPLAFAAEPTPVRAWLATRGEAMAVIVGETHSHTMTEFDTYFDRVVRPSFDAADLALLEAHFDNQSTLDIATNLVLPCSVEAGGRRSERAAPKFAKLKAAARTAGLPVPDWMEHWEFQSEISIHSLHLPGFIAHSVGGAITAAGRPTVMGPGVGSQLESSALANGRGQPIVKGLDSLPDLRDRYCHAPADQRQDLVVADLEVALGRLRLLEDLRNGGLPPLQEAVEASLAMFLRCAERREPCTYARKVWPAVVTLYGMDLNDNLGFFKLGIQARTEAWRSRIVGALEKNRRVFVSVGAAHLPDLRYDERIYSGLISLLQTDGFVLRPIHKLSDLPAQFLHRSW